MARWKTHAAMGMHVKGAEAPDSRTSIPQTATATATHLFIIEARKFNLTNGPMAYSRYVTNTLYNLPASGCGCGWKSREFVASWKRGEKTPSNTRDNPPPISKPPPQATWHVTQTPAQTSSCRTGCNAKIHIKKLQHKHFANAPSTGAGDTGQRKRVYRLVYDRGCISLRLKHVEMLLLCLHNTSRAIPR